MRRFSFLSALLRCSVLLLVLFLPMWELWHEHHAR